MVEIDAADSRHSTVAHLCTTGGESTCSECLETAAGSVVRDFEWQVTYLAVFGPFIGYETNDNEGDDRDTSEDTKADGQDLNLLSRNIDTGGGLRCFSILARAGCGSTASRGRGSVLRRDGGRAL